MKRKTRTRGRTRIEKRVYDRGFFRYADAVAVIKSNRFPRWYREKAARWLLKRTGAREEDKAAAEELLSNETGSKCKTPATKG